MASLLCSIPEETLDQELTDFQLATISTYLKSWKRKARDLELLESDIQEIKKDNKNSYRAQKAVMMRRWKEMQGDGATLRALIQIAERNGWERENMERALRVLELYHKGYYHHLRPLQFNILQQIFRVE